MTRVLWFRRDLRLGDHPALAEASAAGDVLGVFVADDALLKPSGAPRRAFLARTLEALDDTMGGRLLIVHGRPESVIPRLVRSVEAEAVHVSEDFGPYGRRRDGLVQEALEKAGCDWHATGSAYAISPGRVRKPDGTPYAVFTPFHRAWSEHGWRAPAKSGTGVHWIDPESVDLGGGKRWAASDLAVAVDDGLTVPDAGEKAALAAWKDFREAAVADYDTERDRPDHPGTSHMSVHLKWGAIHPRTLLADLSRHRSAGAASYRRELGFRDFYADILFHKPESLTKSVDPAVDRMRWDTGKGAEEHLEAWKAGRTGFPYIDAGMRQLLAEGWMHNRVRMGVASFLIKDLHIPWQLGARHFMEHLIDGDAASNTHGWQWVAGSGAQAAPFYRIFNPVGQGEKHDPTGEYVRQYVPELREVKGKAVHRPWDLPDGLPSGYPDRIVEHDVERKHALSDWEQRPR
ncbi:deoxyribodipyrimidine photo-lyase [Nakamurella sp. YIM 132087]|uniref:Deoxyribodipyrimidine photo-lyase n=1 Tax=Nakamurella alba TaxID=2665158 RepID=A0A7K1FUT2_9ACTN|nr:deoxyribodipyrimidine photo-lyase [Nakamurella alba]MTD16963.1 deoxyribodipyrimidine photo-lyase [Nakamurella alba]